MRLVICDDHQLLLDTLGAALGARGYQVEALVRTAAEALDAVVAHDPDVAVVDVHLADGDGFAVAAEIARVHPRTRTLMLSASADADSIRAALEAGAAGFVRKDQSIEGIVRRLEQVVAGEAAFDLTILQAAVSAPARSSTSDGVRPRLSRRELQVLALLVEGRDTADMARILNIARSTTRTHVQNLLVKLGAHSRLQASVIAVQLGLLDAAV